MTIAFHTTTRSNYTSETPDQIIEALRKQVTDLTDSYTKTCRANQSMAGQLLELEKERDDLQKCFDEQDTWLREKNARIAELEKLRDAIEVVWINDSERLRDVEKERDHFEAKANQLTLDNVALDAHIAELEKKFFYASEQAVRVGDQLEAAQARIAELRDAMEEFKQ